MHWTAGGCDRQAGCMRAEIAYSRQMICRRSPKPTSAPAVFLKSPQHIENRRSLTMLLGRTTLSKFLIQQLNGIDGANDLGALLVDVAAAVKAISAMTAQGALGGYLGALDSKNVHGETQQKLDVLANDVMLRRDRKSVV